MTLSQISPQFIPDGRVRMQTSQGPRLHGHAHFWHRAMSRRTLLKAAGGATAAAIAGSAFLPRVARADHPMAGNPWDPKPIPGGFHLSDIIGETDPDPTFHVFPPLPGLEPSVITDFHGYVGMTEVEGSGTLTDHATGESRHLHYVNDVRFMKGTYVGYDGMARHGTFAFV